MRYIYFNLIAFFGFIFTYFAFHYGYFLNINNFIANIPRTDFLVWLFFFVTDLGSLVFVSIGSVFLIAFLVVKGYTKQGFYTAMALLGGLLTQTIIKNLIEVARPENSLVAYSGYSFPSGHTNMVTILFLSFCFYVVFKIIDRKKRRLYFVVSIIVIILVGLSRVYLNAHWVSDVLAGWCLGIFWATLPLAVVKINTKQRT
jgi:membrane-associated phospholipid phosphatase